MVKTFIAAVMTAIAMPMSAQSFDDYFTDNTLRLDYIFAGDSKKQEISLDELSEMPGWYGRRTRLAELPLEGDGQLTVKDKYGNTIYRHSFNTLFQEWVTYPEAKNTRKSFENSFLIPFPKDTVNVTITLNNSRRKVASEFTHQVVPSDILIRKIGYTKRTPSVVVHQPKDTAHCIHLALVAEGYTDKEMDVFVNDARKTAEYILSYEPFKSMQDRFMITAVKSVSKESGTSVPLKNIWKNTALSSNYSTFYMDRYLTTSRIKRLHDILAGIPYEHIMILVNTEEYGGGGIFNSYHIASAHHPTVKPVTVHEFGHSFAGLADEYAYESEELEMYHSGVEPWEKNITTLTNFDSKWKKYMDKDTPIPTPSSKDENTQFSRIGVFEGAGYRTKGVYRSTERCRMRDNTTPDFCPTCQRSIKELIYFYTLP